MGCKWIFKKKYGLSTKEVILYKASTVAKGYSQKEGMDCIEIFSLVARQISIHVLLALVTPMDMELEQLNVKIVFLHRRLEEDILMQYYSSYTTNYCIENIFKNLYSSPNLWLFCSNFVNKSCFMVKVVSRIFPLNLMMKYVQF